MVLQHWSSQIPTISVKSNRNFTSSVIKSQSLFLPSTIISIGYPSGPKNRYYHGQGIPLYSPIAFEGMRKAGKLAANCLRHLHDVVEPGISTYDIHNITTDYITSNGGIPSSLGYKGFPGSICTSNNTVACHGVPRKDEILNEGDLISLDVTCLVDGFYGDTCYTYFVGDVSKMDLRTALFLYVSKQARDEAIKICKPLQDVNRIGTTIENYLKQFCEQMSGTLGENQYHDKYEVLREFTGHGIGTEIHQSPEILHFGLMNNKREGVIMNEGLVFTIEPIILWNPPPNKRFDGRRSFLDVHDKWTVRVPDVISAQFEHCVGVTSEGVEVFTMPDDPYPDVWNDVLQRHSNSSIKK